ncbi:hypothetical protein SAMN06297251_108115 [Fulvimarina manganoxydans]|uniref:Uncharacterized protein n=1 Tax=Fulvimarina manganoxydans TaxID=937218 RepID=A0A1W2C3U1_9HYPH|nr:hypothetical protein SAMN06297251_108115 [Fulvimarina manganoxydans]
MPLRRIDLLALAVTAGFAGEEAKWMLSLDGDQRTSIVSTDRDYDFSDRFNALAEPTTHSRPFDVPAVSSAAART